MHPWLSGGDLMQMERASALSAGLKLMFGKLAGRPVPEHIARVVDQLEAAVPEADAPKPYPEPPSTPAP
jgi:hypothetical protein